ncbi:hypothetical protein SAMN02745121_00316 [Nannocystis exedens]|uniref:Uncharacterized protein n=1 Tax=Nannocystis exedens TaxID=54 RepID=A0A1I1SVU7_9BACT|nr:hypothetical protein [Nannocystis exedens]PCC66953.1 hypothetical protein NAEX_09552 [Nannocystis exedens]SFD50595.1 hypothetical protein SAMN02745121_00316 [Nannocystis exedens]
MPRRALLLSTLVAACAGEPQVEVLTRSSADTLQAQAWADRFELWFAQAAALADGELDAAVAELPLDEPELARAPKRKPKAGPPREPEGAGPEEQELSDRVDAPGIEGQPVAPPTTADELARVIAALRDGPHRDLGPLARALAAAPPSLWPELRAQLLAPRTARKADYKAMLSVIGGDVPNRYGHFELAWKKAHGHHGVKLSEDWFTDLLALPSRQVSKVLRPIYRDCVIQAALLRAAATIGAEPAHTDDVVEALLAAAYLHESTFRDEVGRAIRRLGDPALPGLLRRSIRPPLPADEGEAQVVKDSVAYRTAEYAGYQIDRMDRAHPRKALQAVSDDPARLAELIAAYGVVRPGDAAGPLLDFVDAAIPPVREAAREAFLAYVTGPAPRAERKLLRFVGGGTGESAAQLTYRDLARIAIMSRIASHHPDLAEPDCRSAPKDSVIAEACEGQPERLARAYFQRLDDGRRQRERAEIAAALREPDRAAAIAILDRLLADDPGLSARAELVPTYEQAAAEAAAAGDLALGARLWRKSAALLEDVEPGRADALRVRALLAEADLAGTEEGRRMLLATAAELAPEDPELQARLTASVERPETAATEIRTRLAYGTGLAVGGLSLLLGLGGLFNRSRARA